ncbi:riboflavin kinase [[Acholeplasma] multilocale]|uniref:riboflavin kinase n=1 Tax=[Acholeplasma] multilocale TaxID=264638 RepID=UPI000684AC50|nr:riboflavin kinase [[Acholeplasma] multilocale]
MRTVNYNEMAMMLYNMKPSIGLVGNWGNWTDNEYELIQHAKAHNPSNLDMNLIVMTEDYNIGNIFSNNIIEAKAKEMGVGVIYWYQPIISKRNWDNLKRDLNITCLFAFSNVKGFHKIKTSFAGVVDGIEFKTGMDEDLINSKEFLANGQVEEYKALNKANFQLTAHVAHGNKIGRTLGYPTANLLTEKKLQIKKGVYLVKVTLPNEDFFHWGISAFWINQNKIEVFETHILDFDQDIYDWRMTVELVSYLRDNVQVESTEQLIDLLNQDKKTAQELISKGA